MPTSTQISAFISAHTRDRLERYTEAHGLKKAAVIEAALLHHLQALDELPVDIIVPPCLTVDAADFAQLSALAAAAPPPTAALRALMSGQPVEGLDD